MKKIAIIALSLALIFSMTGCGKLADKIGEKVTNEIGAKISDKMSGITGITDNNNHEYTDDDFTATDEELLEPSMSEVVDENLDYVEIIEGFPVNASGQELIDLCYPVLIWGAFSNCLKSQHFSYIGEETDSDYNQTISTLDYWTYGGNAAFESVDDGKYVYTILRYNEFHQYLIPKRDATVGYKFPIYDESQSGFFDRAENLEVKNGEVGFFITNPRSGDLVEARLIDVPNDDIRGLDGGPGLYIERIGPAGLVHKTWYSLKLGMFYKAVIESDEGQVFNELELVVYDSELEYKDKVTPSKSITWKTGKDLVEISLADLGLSLDFDALPLPNLDGAAGKLTDKLGEINRLLESKNIDGLDEILSGESEGGLDALKELLDSDDESASKVKELLESFGGGEEGENSGVLDKLLGGDKSNGLGKLKGLLDGFGKDKNNDNNND